MNRILMDAVPTWTNKEVLYAFGSAAAVLIPALISLYRILSSNLHKQLAKITEERDELKKSENQHVRELMTYREEANKQIVSLTKDRDIAAKDLAEARKLVHEHGEIGIKLQGELEASRVQYLSAKRRVQRALGANGFTWTEKVRHNAPDFRSLDERRTPIISVLNLKGGVGKTTLTANLGAALSRRGWKVLMIDLDLQGSLTSLFMPEQDQTALDEKQRFIGDFLARSFDAEFPNLLDYTHPILGSSGSAIVGTVDTLAYAETKLTVRWLLREGKGNRDPRFILRRELHLKRISDTFDIVLLDCPPLINVSCVNALAASDSVLIPVMPSKPTTDRVPVLLSRMIQFQQNINSQLKILGLVANRTYGSQLTSDETNRLTELERKAKDTWGDKVTRLETFIPQNTELRAAEDAHRPLASGDRMAEVFHNLAQEVERRLPTFCRPTGHSTLMKTEVMQ